MDVLNRILLSSDPFEKGLRPAPRKNRKLFLKETVAMLCEIEPDLATTCVVETSSGEEELLSDEEH